MARDAGEEAGAEEQTKKGADKRSKGADTSMDGGNGRGCPGLPAACCCAAAFPVVAATWTLALWARAAHGASGRAC